MKKIFSKIISAAVCAGIVLSTAMSAAAETVTVEPDYPIHGNKCGTVVITPELDREVYVKITQLTPDGDYVYYNTVLPAGGETVGETDYSFIVEGKDDSSYTITLGVPEHKGSKDTQEITYDFTVSDTDYIVDKEINGYVYLFSVLRNDDLEQPEITAEHEAVMDENNIVTTVVAVTFPASDITPGDVNFDEVINLYDVIEITKYMMDPSYFGDDQISAADYNADGKVNLYDAIDIAKMIMNMK